MWRKQEESKPSPSPAEAPQTPRPESVRSVAGLTAELIQPSGGVITSSFLVKGEIRGREDLYIDGELQGTVHLTDGRVTVGPHGRVTANVEAREIVVRGKVKGMLRGHERVEIGSTGETRGDITTVRIAIDDGAQVHSKVEVMRPQNAQREQKSAKLPGVESMQTRAMKATGDLAN
jgi:cytoskeletal protein CcmA (bactofilin family)